MSRMLVQRFAKSKLWLIGLSSVALFSTGTMFKNLSGNYKAAGAIQNGLQVCANRAHQTYTASVIGDTSSIHMDSGFTGATEECFAEAGTLMEDSQGLAPSIARRMNTLNSNVHWFHEALRSTGKGFSVKEQESNGKIDKNYEKVELSVESVADLMEAHVDLLDSSMTNLKFALAMASLILMGAGAWELLDRKRASKEKKEVEDEAYCELISEDNTTASKVEEIIVNALELNEMTHCSKLLTTYRQNVLKSTTQAGTSLRTTTMPMAMLFDDDKDVVEDAVQKVWEQSETVEEIITTTEMEPITSKIVDHLSNKLIAEGIIVDMTVDDSLIKAESESLEQILFYVLQDALANTGNPIERKVTIRGKALGSVYNFEVISSGLGKDASDNMSLEIAKELLLDISGRLEIVDTYGEQREVNGRKIRVILKSTPKTAITLQEQIEAEVVLENKRGKTLVRLEKGTKRELLERMSS